MGDRESIGWSCGLTDSLAEPPPPPPPLPLRRVGRQSSEARAARGKAHMISAGVTLHGPAARRTPHSLQR